MHLADEPIPRVSCINIDLPTSPDGASFEAFRRNSAPLLEVSLADPEAAARFAFKASVFQMPGAVLTWARGPAFLGARSPDMVARDPAPPVAVNVLLSGTCETQVDGKVVRSGPGDVLFQDYARPFGCTNSDYEVVIAMVGRDRAPPTLLQAAAHCARLTCEGGPAQVTAAAARALLDAMPSFTIVQAELAAGAFFSLAAGMLEDHLATRNSYWEEPPLTLDAALRFIEERLHDRMLDVAAMTRRFGVSRSALYRLFQPLGGVDEAIRVRRLDRAMRAILSGSPREMETARQSFRNEEHFARAFQARFGERPAKFRSKVQSQDKDWLSSQAVRAGFSSQEAWLKALRLNT